MRKFKHSRKACILLIALVVGLCLFYDVPHSLALKNKSIPESPAVQNAVINVPVLPPAIPKQERTTFTIANAPASVEVNVYPPAGQQDNNYGFLQLLIGGLGVTVAIITVLLAGLSIFGYFEVTRWRRTRKEFEEKTKEATDIVEGMKQKRREVDDLRNQIPASIIEHPSEEIKEKFDEFAKRIEFLEATGMLLKAEDYLKISSDYYFKGNYLQALKVVDQAIKLKSDDADAWFNKGVILAKLEKYEEALKAFVRAIELKPDYVGAWTNKGGALLELERYEEALKTFDRAIELKPNSEKAWNNKGVSLSKLEKLEEALKAFDRAVELKPDYAIALINRAGAYALKGEREKALEDLAKAIELDKKCKELAKKDKDFASLRDDPDFKKLVE